MRKIGLIIALMIGAFAVFGQGHTCLTDEHHEHLMQTDPDYRAGYLEARKRSELMRGSVDDTTILKVPVVVHVIHNGGIENISYAQVVDAIAVLNEDFRRMNADTVNTQAVFKNVARDTRIEFYLANYDENGECTDGVVKVKSAQTYNAHNHVKDLSSWDHRKYMNIWVVHSIENTFGGNGTILGFAYYPNPNQSYYNDGILIRHDCMGRIGSANGGFGPNAQGRTLTHEVGHYLGLPHTFNGSSCSLINDGFDDTPPIAGPSSGCLSAGFNTCGGNDPNDLPDQTENYMDYSYGICQNMLTEDQMEEMRSNLLPGGVRWQLTNVLNQAITGILTERDTCAPIADIRANNAFICVGDSVELYDMSWNAPVTSRTWSVPGATLSSTTDSSVWVYFNSQGSYSPSITVSNSKGSDSFTWTDGILVRNSQGMVPMNYTESFEPGTNFAQDWYVDSTKSIHAFEITNYAYDGAQGLELKNYYMSTDMQSSLILPTLDLAGLGAASELSFWYAHASKSDDNEDMLKVYISRNCGLTWTPRKVLTGNSLRTVSNVNWTEWSPASVNAWQQAVISLAPYQNDPEILVKLEFTSDGGNNLYLDMFQIGQGLGTEEFLQEVTLYPNPADQNAFVDLSMLGEEVHLEVLDQLGRVVHSDLMEGSALQEPYALPGKSSLNSGTYFVTLRAGNAQKVLPYILL